MKIFLLLSIAVLISVLVFAKQRECNELVYQDSTLHQRFIMNILQEYELEGRWIFVRIDSVYKLKNNYELIHPKNIYEAYNEGFSGVNKKRFLYYAYEALTLAKIFERYPEHEHPIKGIKVNMKSYDILKRMPIDKLLATYFNENRQLKNQYNKCLYEIIAVCYTNNVKVITPEIGPAYYEVFK
jgi:hypothetical protein